MIDNSFQLIRTNTLLTSNVKINISSNDELYLESINSTNELNYSKYKNYRILKDSKYETHISNFYNKLNNNIVFYTKNIEDDNFTVYDDYNNQINTLYICGASKIGNKQYTEDYEYFAPLYIKKNKIPDGFIIFKVKDSNIFNNTKYDQLSSTDISNIKNDVINNFKVVKYYNLKKDSNIGYFLNENINNNKNFPDYTLNFNFNNDKNCEWIGLDYYNGIYTKKEKNFKDYLKWEQPHYKFEKFITEQYSKNNLIYPYIWNFNFLFSDISSNNYEFNRYYGFYIDKLEFVEQLSTIKYIKLLSDIKIKNNIFLDQNNNYVYPYINKNINDDVYIKINKIYYTVKKIKLEDGNFYYKIISDIIFNIDDIFDIITENNLSINNNILSFDDNYKIDNYIDSDITEKFLYADIYLLQIDDMYHIFKYDSSINKYIIVSDYNINSINDNIQYKLNDITIKSTNSIHNLYRIKFCDIKDIDNDILNTKFTDFDFEKDNYIDTVEKKINTIDYREKSESIIRTHNIGEQGQDKKINLSTEYIDELFEIDVVNNKLNSIWYKNPIFTKWGYSGSLSNQKYPYKLNNNLKYNDNINRASNNLIFEPSILDKNLSYFFKIGNFKTLINNYPEYNNELLLGNGNFSELNFNNWNYSIGNNIGNIKIINENSNELLYINSDTTLNYTQFQLEYSGLTLITGISYKISFDIYEFDYYNDITSKINISGSSLNININYNITKNRVFEYEFTMFSNNFFNINGNVYNLKINNIKIWKIKNGVTKDAYFKNQNLNIETNLLNDTKFDLDKYINNDFDYFNYFFKNNSYVEYNNKLELIKNINYSVFNKDDKSYSTIFKGLKYRITSVDQFNIIDNKIENISFKNDFDFNNYKLSIILSENYKEYIYSTGQTQYIYANSYISLDKKLFYNYSLNPSNFNMYIVPLSAASYNNENITISANYNNINCYTNKYLTGTTFNTSIISGVSYFISDIIDTDGINNFNLFFESGTTLETDSILKIYIIETDKDYLDNYPNYSAYTFLDNVFKSNYIAISGNTIYNNNYVYTNFKSNKEYRIIIKKTFKNYSYSNNFKLFLNLMSYNKQVNYITSGETYNTSLINYTKLSNNKDTGIHIFINKKYKNILCIINSKIAINKAVLKDFNTINSINNMDDILNYIYYGINDNDKLIYDDAELSNISPISNNDRYKPSLYTARNFTDAINNLNETLDFDKNVTYYTIDDNGNLGSVTMTEFDKSSINKVEKNIYPSFLLSIESPDSLNIYKDSYDYNALNLSKDLIQNFYIYDDNKNIKNFSTINEPVYRSIVKNDKVSTTYIDTIYRYSGIYDIIFKNINIFNSTYYWKTNNTNYNFTDNYIFDNNLYLFGYIDENRLSKINEKINILSLNKKNYKSIYPMLDEFGISIKPKFIFKSTWDNDFYYKSLTDKIYYTDKYEINTFINKKDIFNLKVLLDDNYVNKTLLYKSINSSNKFSPKILNKDNVERTCYTIIESYKNDIQDIPYTTISINNTTIKPNSIENILNNNSIDIPLVDLLNINDKVLELDKYNIKISIFEYSGATQVIDKKDFTLYINNELVNINYKDFTTDKNINYTYFNNDILNCKITIYNDYNITKLGTLSLYIYNAKNEYILLGKKDLLVSKNNNIVEFNNIKLNNITTNINGEQKILYFQFKYKDINNEMKNVDYNEKYIIIKNNAITVFKTTPILHWTSDHITYRYYNGSNTDKLSIITKISNIGNIVYYNNIFLRYILYNYDGVSIISQINYNEIIKIDGGNYTLLKQDIEIPINTGLYMGYNYNLKISCIDENTNKITGSSFQISIPGGRFLNKISNIPKEISNFYCLDTETLITLSNGKNIKLKDIKIGDKLKSLNIRGDYNNDKDWNLFETNNLQIYTSISTVIDIKTRTVSEYYRINDRINITSEHPIFIKRYDVWKWIKASEIYEGDIMLNIDDDEIVVFTNEIKNETLDVILLNVEDIDNYYANGILVHNRKYLS